jgi:hypothetical protein
MKKTICVLFYSDERYEKMSQVSLNSFKKFHPNIPTFVYNMENVGDLFTLKMKVPFGILKYMVALAKAKSEKAGKVIILGCDTITCSRLDEFIENEEDILCTLDYPYKLVTPFIQSPDSETHVNADVVCFNNLEALSEVIKASFKHTTYFEQGGLNEILWAAGYNFSHKIVDAPYEDSDVVYNARAKGNLCASSGTKPWKEFTTKFEVIEDKLYTGLHRNNQKVNKQIKVWHYCEGLGTLHGHRFEDIINWWIEEGFNEDTKSFFNNVCASGDFFDKEFKI